MTVDRVVIEPRPHTSRLADVAAGGIELNALGVNNAVQQSVIIGAQDDSIAGYVPSNYTGNPPDNLVVVGNTIENSFLARGIAFTSVIGAHITQNTIYGTQQAGIYLGGANESDQMQPVSGVQVTNNTLTNTIIGPSGVGFDMLGAIEVMYYQNGQAVSIFPNNQVFINNNIIDTTLRSAIWVGNVDGGAVKQNTVNNYGLSGGSLGAAHCVVPGSPKCGIQA